jgi:YVTN family beta-propeller protein
MAVPIRSGDSVAIIDTKTQEVAATGKVGEGPKRLLSVVVATS